jgi:hypothetical protein
MRTDQNIQVDEMYVSGYARGQISINFIFQLIQLNNK